MFDPISVGLVCLAGAGLLMAFAWYLCNVVLPLIESAVNEAGFTRSAKSKARALFLSKLTARQRRGWLLRRRISILAKSGRRYTLRNYEAFNIHSWDAAFCLQVDGELPNYDKLLAQKLLIECDEAVFLAHSNVRTFSSRWQHLIAAARADSRARGLFSGEDASEAA